MNNVTIKEMVCTVLGFDTAETDVIVEEDNYTVIIEFHMDSMVNRLSVNSHIEGGIKLMYISKNNNMVFKTNVFTIKELYERIN
jgi:hypothetical protein